MAAIDGVPTWGRWTGSMAHTGVIKDNVANRGQQAWRRANIKPSTKGVPST